MDAPLSLNPRTISAGWMEAVLDGLVAHGLSRVALTDGIGELRPRTGLPNRQLEIMSARQLWYRVAELSDDPLLGLKVGAALPPQALNIVALIAMHSPTLAEMGHNTRTYQGLISNSGFYEQRVARAHVDLDYVPTEAPLAQHPMQIDSILAATISNIRRAGLADFSPAEVRVTNERLSEQSAFEAFFGCPVVMTAPLAGYRLTQAQLALRLPFADASLLAHLRAHGDMLLAAQGRLDRLAFTVRSAIAARGPKSVTLDAVASDLGLGSRTLQRRLVAAGTSFRALCDEARLEEAERLLRGTALPIAAIADRLGYAEVSSFSRAVQAHFGCRPNSLRESAVRAKEKAAG